MAEPLEEEESSDSLRQKDGRLINVEKNGPYLVRHKIKITSHEIVTVTETKVQRSEAASLALVTVRQYNETATQLFMYLVRSIDTKHGEIVPGTKVPIRLTELEYKQKWYILKTSNNYIR